MKTESNIWRSSRWQCREIKGHVFHLPPIPKGVMHKAIPKTQRLLPLNWQDELTPCQGDRARALHLAYRAGGATMTAWARQAGLSVTQVSRLIAKEESYVKREAP
jgi:hypothetical protein